MIAEIVFAFLLAILVAALLAPLGGYRGRPGQAVGSAFLFFFLMAFFFIWAAGAWATPWGPVYFGISWVPFLFWAVVIGLLIAAIAAVPEAGTTRTSAEVTPEDAVGGVASAFGIFFMLLIILLAIGAIWAAVS